MRRWDLREVDVKPHQPDALETLCRLTEWLNERHIKLVGGLELEEVHLKRVAALRALDRDRTIDLVDPGEIEAGDRVYGRRRRQPAPAGIEARSEPARHRSRSRSIATSLTHRRQRSIPAAPDGVLMQMGERARATRFGQVMARLRFQSRRASGDTRQRGWFVTVDGVSRTFSSRRAR